MKHLTLLLTLLTASSGITQTIKTVPVQDTLTMDGPTLFNEYCAVCHGKDGRGAGPAAAALKKTPADLTQLARKNNGKFDQLAVKTVIEGKEVTAAHGSRDMPTWGTVFASLNRDEGRRNARIALLVEQIGKMQAK